MAELTSQQLRAMFSKSEIKRGISSKDITDRRLILARQGLLPKQKVTPEVREIMLPTKFKVIKTGERRGEVVLKKRFGPSRPGEPASEAQIRALERIEDESQTGLTREQAFRKFQKANRFRAMEIVVGLEGGRTTDPVVQSEILRLTPEQRLDAREQLQRLASRKGKASPLELPPSDIRFILNRVKPRR